MVDFFDRFYGSLLDRKRYLVRIRYYKALRAITRWSANKIIPIYFFLTKNNKRYSLCTLENKNKNTIVSLTTFPVRIKKVWLAIETILRQTEKPDRLILWLSQEQFPSIENLPARLLKQRDRGLEIELRAGNLLSHKKYFFTQKEYPGAIMITIDDDIFYPSDMIEELLRWHKIFPNSIIARYGMKIKFIENKIFPYKFWETFSDQRIPSFEFFFGSGGGTLFPANFLTKEDLDENTIMALCPYADDVWLNTLCRLKKIKIFRTRFSLCSILPVSFTGNLTLAAKNYQQDLNDKQLKAVRDHFRNERGVDPIWDTLDLV